MSPLRGSRLTARRTAASWAARLVVVLCIPALVGTVVYAQHQGPAKDEETIAEDTALVEAQREAQPPVREREEQVAASRSSRAPVELARAVTLVVRGTATRVETDVNTVSDLLEAERVDLGPDDRVRPGPHAPLRMGMRVEVDVVDIETEVETEPVAFETVRRETSSRQRGTEVIVQDGADGARETTRERVLVNGFVESVNVVDEQVTEPTDRVVEVGTAPPPEPKAKSSGGGDNRVWERLAQCESNGNWQAVNPAGPYYGGLQFMKGTWDSVGGTEFAEYPHQASKAQQITAGKRLQRAAGWGQWPACSKRLGLN